MWRRLLRKRWVLALVFGLSLVYFLTSTFKQVSGRSLPRVCPGPPGSLPTWGSCLAAAPLRCPGRWAFLPGTEAGRRDRSCGGAWARRRCSASCGASNPGLWPRRRRLLPPGPAGEPSSPHLRGRPGGGGQPAAPVTAGKPSPRERPAGSALRVRAAFSSGRGGPPGRLAVGRPLCIAGRGVLPASHLLGWNATCGPRATGRGASVGSVTRRSSWVCS